MFGGHERTYLAYVPASYTGKDPVPLIFDFHGYGQSVTSQLGASGFSELADEHGFVVVYPAGVGGSWHVNGCCGQAASEKLDEIGAVREVLKQLSSEVCVDPKRIYASGISQGGGMAHHVGCLAADVFAAVAPVSSDLRTEPCMPSRPVSEISFRGTADTLSAYEGGPVGPAGMQYQSIGAKATLERWKAIDQCSGMPETNSELCETYKQCASGTEVTLCTIPGGGHALYSNPRSFNLAKVAWEMFERQKMP
jgi:polyhydroxybutyrate depolymerase